MKYNLACGNDIRFGYKNLDKDDIDLNNNFYLKDCEEVLMYHSFEHLHNPLDALRNIYISLNNDGKLKVKLPTFANYIFHKQPINNEKYFDCFIGKNKGMIFDKDIKFKLLRVEYRCFKDVKRNKEKNILFKTIDFFKKLMIFLKMLWYDEVYFELKK